MNLSTDIIHYLPMLRRYARAVTGQQVTGDDCVALMIERSVRRGNGKDCISVKVALYRELSDCLAAADRVQSTTETSAAGHLQGLTITARQALLLTSLEGMSEVEAAEVLRLPRSEVREHCEIARRRLETLVFADVLIIEDEFFISRELAKIVTSLGHRVLARARTHGEARAAVAAKQPSLILADVHLADGSSGIEAVTEIVGTAEVPVIFITAFPERLLTGLRPEPTFLITKPYRIEEVKAVISQCLFFNQKAMLRSEPDNPCHPGSVLDDSSTKHPKMAAIS